MEFDKEGTDTRMRPIATVTGLYRGTSSGLEPLTKDTPLTLDEVRRSPVFFELDLNPELEDADLIIEVRYDDLIPLVLQDLERGTNLPKGTRFWPYWFEIPGYLSVQGSDGRRVYPRAPGTHTVRIRTARRKIGQPGKARDFRPANHGYTSPVFELTIVPGGGEDV
jgi:hypothetical protein